jgi:hypothetical protein
MVEPVAARQLRDRDLYRLRAEQARAEADEATLDNVRDRCLRAEAAWMEMAARAERTEKMRADQLAAKAALADAAQD